MPTGNWSLLPFLSSTVMVTKQTSSTPQQVNATQVADQDDQSLSENVRGTAKEPGEGRKANTTGAIAEGAKEGPNPWGLEAFVLTINVALLRSIPTGSAAGTHRTTEKPCLGRVSACSWLPWQQWKLRGLRCCLRLLLYLGRFMSCPPLVVMLCYVVHIPTCITKPKRVSCTDEMARRGDPTAETSLSRVPHLPLPPPVTTRDAAPLGFGVEESEVGPT
ncbi:hypothetical protein B296_00017515 [Ensete ventricosum]|uniref:Uncharacterized protein n=1 Tax=Ensete ventricosum TaxID=4639 RepID=A0A427A765_ENSVE|nr:hypothetical protein B296_00017515 [Ensete ventricosum]